MKNTSAFDAKVFGCLFVVPDQVVMETCQIRVSGSPKEMFESD